MRVRASIAAVALSCALVVPGGAAAFAASAPPPEAVAEAAAPGPTTAPGEAEGAPEAVPEPPGPTAADPSGAAAPDAPPAPDPVAVPTTDPEAATRPEAVPAPEAPGAPAPGAEAAVETPAPLDRDDLDGDGPDAAPTPTAPESALPRLTASASPLAIDPGALVGLADATLADTLAIAWWGTTDPGTRVTFANALANAPAGSTIHLDTTLGTAFRFTPAAFSRTQSVTIEAAQPVQLYFARLNVTGAAIAFGPNVVLSPTANSQIALNVTSATAPTITGLQVANDPVTPRTGGTAIALNATSGATVVGLATLGVATGANLNTSTGATLTGATLTSPTVGVNLATASGATVSGTTITGAASGLVTTAASTATGPQVSSTTVEATTVGLSLGATSGASVTDSTFTHLGDPTNNAGVLGVNVNNASNVTISNTSATGFRSGVIVSALSDAAPLTITGGAFDAVVSGISLGSTSGAVITDVSVTGVVRAVAGATMATTAIDVLAATGTQVTSLTARDVLRGVNVPVTNTSGGLAVDGGDLTLTALAGAVGVNLGSTDGAVVTGLTVTGADRAISRTYGVTTNRARSSVIDGLTATRLSIGIAATWERLSGRTIPGPTVTNAQLSEVGIGVYTANTVGAVVRDSRIDAWGEGVAGHEDADFTLTDTHITGHAGSTLQNGTNCVRFYYTDGMTVSNVTTVGGSTGLYLDMSSDIVAENIDVSGAVWYGTYAESITGYELRDSAFRDNGGIGNLTINPSSVDAIDLRQVSSDILFEDNTFTDNVAGLYLPLGAFDITFQRNVVTGTRTYVLRATPAYDVTVQDNRIDYTHDPASLSLADALEAAVPLPEAPPDPPIADVAADSLPAPLEGPPPTATGATPGTTALAASLVLPASAVPPPTAAAAIWVAPDWFDLDTDSASSSDIAVLDNPFTGDGPFVGVGSVSTIDKGSDAPPNPSVMRSLRSTIEVSRNVFPRDSTAIVTIENAEIGVDGNPANTMINGDVAVDARGANDWGSPCFARAPTDLYDGGGAFIHEVRRTQVLYPQGCDGPPTVSYSATVQCTDGALTLDYALDLANVPNLPQPVIAAIWWSPDAFAAHDPSIPAADTDAILADGAIAVDRPVTPDGWTSPGVVDGALAFPPGAPAGVVLEMRVDTSSDAQVAPPPTTSVNCGETGGTTPPGPAPGGTTRVSTAPSGLAATGFDLLSSSRWALALLAGGALALGARAALRRRAR
ncbi:right-handed parallel beta-helix repeat-containing protein [Oerskovia turbata]